MLSVSILMLWRRLAFPIATADSNPENQDLDLISNLKKLRGLVPGADFL